MNSGHRDNPQSSAAADRMVNHDEQRDVLEETFVQSDDQDKVEDSFCLLLPSEPQCQAAARERNPKKFIGKLRDIGSSARVKTAAVKDFAGAQLMRLRCEARRFSKNRLIRFDERLLEIYDSANDALGEPPSTLEKQKDRGKKLLDVCNTRAEQEKLTGYTFDTTVAKGELQVLADGGGFVKREISWLMK